jgi:NAD kinase
MSTSRISSTTTIRVRPMPRVRVVCGKEGETFTRSAAARQRALTAAGMTAEIATGWDDVAAPEFDLLLVLGGDGTYLRAVQAIAESGLNVPILGINHGVLTSPFFGQPTRARNAREVSLSLRFNF